MFVVRVVADLEVENVDPVVEDTLGGVGHEGQVVGAVDHLGVVVVKGSNLNYEFLHYLATL